MGSDLLLSHARLVHSSVEQCDSNCRSITITITIHALLSLLGYGRGILSFSVQPPILRISRQPGQLNYFLQSGIGSTKNFGSVFECRVLMQHQLYQKKIHAVLLRVNPGYGRGVLSISVKPPISHYKDWLVLG